MLKDDENLNQMIEQLGFQAWSFVPLSKAHSIAQYESWLDKDFHGSMKYLKDHLHLKQNPAEIDPRIKSALVFTFSYAPHPKPVQVYPGLNIAKYARGEDYHHWLRQKLNLLVDYLQQKYPNEYFLCFTDSGPVLERDLAATAGLGWIGKNTCLIDRKNGSFKFICEIFTSLESSNLLQVPKDFCGNCNRCIEACPTNAFEAPRVLNATKCISYHNIESRENPPIDLRAKIHDQFFGCDICQTVCPWNQKVIGKNAESDNIQAAATQETITSLQEILQSSGKKIEQKTLGTALRRAGPFGLKRNALVVAANLNLKSLLPEIEKLKSNPKLAELANWASNKIKAFDGDKNTMPN